MSKWISKSWEMPSVKTDPPVQRALKMLFSPEVNGYEKATILLSVIPPGSKSEEHTHPDSDEIMYFLGRGEGTLGKERVKIEQDLIIVAPKGVPHQVFNTSDTDTLKIICIYIPPVKPSELLAKAAQLSREKLISQE